MSKTPINIIALPIIACLKFFSLNKNVPIRTLNKMLVLFNEIIYGTIEMVNAILDKISEAAVENPQ